jgi:hypothetical protein
MIGIAPSTGGHALKIAIGGLIALAVIGYVASHWKIRSKLIKRGRRPALPGRFQT